MTGKGKGKDARVWLEDVTPDQNLEEIGQIDSTQMNGIRRWFMSRIISPFYKKGGYNHRTGRIQLGDNPPQTMGQPSTQITAAAQATATLTCPVGHVFEVLMANAENNSGASDYSMVYTPAQGGGAMTVTEGPNGLVNVLVPLLGYNQASHDTVAKPMWMAEGDTLVITDNSWAAAENEVFRFYFIDYTVA